jgi:hypothetical protein
MAYHPRQGCPGEIVEIVVWRKAIDGVSVGPLTAGMIVPLVEKPDLRKGILSRTMLVRFDAMADSFAARAAGALEKKAVLEPAAPVP